MQYDKQGRPIIDPEIVTDEKYQRAYSEQALMDKLPRVAKKLGRAALTQVLRLYYVLKRKDLPGKTRVIILGALGYFILPLDFLPDFLPIVGLTDDIGLLVAAFAAASQYMDDDVKAKADAKVNSLLGPELP
jgi:uncharacterized membrane protein YkvA (DUF1232 family)